ncbi:CPBP family intramembrane glutamic endopeptidase [Tabrizicola sp.]|uniref:CPBP family intramembrane glutamic endopeptidase n=1 Tax=Tabrizicola sp. TaxID=2005166 RepID=UPI00286A7012|nr:CPBP family intramembrane glutamic endopeptidase [Tabrizicola sp.]
MTEPLTLPQYSLAKILAIWAAVAIPMPVMAFWVAPLLSTATGLYLGIVIWGLMILGMIWQFALSCLLLRAEAGPDRQGTWAQRLWLQTPRDPGTGWPRLVLLWWVVPVLIGTFLIEQTGLADALAAPLLWVAPQLALVPAPDLASLAQPQFVGAWWLIPMALVSCLFNYALGEELLFRGVLLPRMNGAFGRWDWAANAVLFGTYHLIRPLTIPAIVLSTMLWTYPCRRFRSVWFALIPHAVEGVVVLALVVALVFGQLTV